MPHHLCGFPFPWDHPLAMSLHAALYKAYPVEPQALQVIEAAGLDGFQLARGQPPALLWQSALELAGRTGLTCQLLQTVHDRQPASSAIRPLLADILADRPTAADPEPRSADGAPQFRHADDTVSTDEALLYRDDLTIPVGRVPALVATLQRLADAARGVCKLSVSFGAFTKYGTAFRITPDRLLTNWHVLTDAESGKRASAVTAVFGYEDDGKGGELPTKTVPCDPASIVTDKADDWAVITPTGMLPADCPTFVLSAAAVPVVDGTAFIIQHPAGQLKRVGFVRNQISFVDDRVVQYLTDTQEGSSGAPVFDDQGRLIAIHHAGGQPQTVTGRTPLKKNEGIRITAVRAGLIKANIAVL